MNTEKLSRRLETVAKYIPKGNRLADIGSDHAYLPCHVIKNKNITFAIAGEVAEGPFQSAKKQVELEGLTNNILVRKGDGLEVISSGEIDVITIAGMGGALIASILEQGKEKLSTVKRLILQPNISAVSIRTWLIAHGWELVAEEILEEDGKIYEVLVAQQGDPLKPFHKEEIQKDLLLGPFLRRERSEPFLKKWKNEISNWERILVQMEGGASQNEETMKKREELEMKIKMVKEACEN